MQVCPGSLIKLAEDKKAYIKYPKDCWGCSSCLKECSFGAISFYLGADIGGMGSKLITSIEGDIVHWQIEKTNGDLSVIDVNRKDSNQY
jgi:adenylylsulfate reductase subunit B